jgi:D-glycero-beta-D-manno-heptose 1-phosphate adenylyltransferase
LFAILHGCELRETDVGQVISQEELILHRSEWKRNGKRVVFASGCFDLIHPGHIRLLEQARDLGEILVVGVQSDAAIRSSPRRAQGVNDGFERPITPASERMEILAAFVAVDYAVEFDAPTPNDLVARLEPDIIVVGGRDSASESAGRDIVSIPLEPGFSTSRLIERITQLRA